MRLNDIKNFSKRFGVNLLESFIINVVRGMINESLKNIEPIDVFKAIKENTNLWSVAPDKLKKTGFVLKRRFGDIIEKFKDNIRLEIILAWLREDKPEIYSTIINTPGGEEWLSRQIEDIKEKLLS